RTAPTPTVLLVPPSYLCLLISMILLPIHALFFFTTPATTEIYTLSLHDVFRSHQAAGELGHFAGNGPGCGPGRTGPGRRSRSGQDRKSTRLNSSHVKISYAVFCLKKKKKEKNPDMR